VDSYQKNRTLRFYRRLLPFFSCAVLFGIFLYAYLYTDTWGWLIAGAISVTASLYFLRVALLKQRREDSERG